MAGELCCPESRRQRLLIEAGRPGGALKGRASLPRAPPEGSRTPAPARSSGSSGLKVSRQWAQGKGPPCGARALQGGGGASHLALPQREAWALVLGRSRAPLRDVHFSPWCAVRPPGFGPLSIVDHRTGYFY